MGQFALILVDEVHILGEDRGAALEAVRVPILIRMP
jgi:replicative superfamily II helicase